jgi:protein-glutamine gamma-glutamyltransferase
MAATFAQPLAQTRERLAHLPRDSRDTLFRWPSSPGRWRRTGCTCPGGAAACRWRCWPGARRWRSTAARCPAAGSSPPSCCWPPRSPGWEQRTLLGKEAGITLLVVLMSLKTLELRARRDALVVFFLGFFLVLTHFLYSQSLLTGLWLLTAVWGLLTALALAHMPVGRPPLARAVGVAARTALIGVPVMVALFVLFPRIGPLWGLPQDAAGRTGLSGTLRLGGVASVADDDSIALRIRFAGAVPPPEQLYFRGPVLSSFDGREWRRLVPSFPVTERPRLELELRGAPVAYEMTIEPSPLPLLPLLEMTPDRPGAAPEIPGRLLTLRPDGQWQSDRPLVERQRVNVVAWPEHRHGPRNDVLGLRDLVDLPPNRNPRTLQWADDCAGAWPRRAANPAPRRWPTPCWRTSVPVSSRTRWSPGPTARTPSTNSGSTASWASASTSPVPLW